MTHCGQTEEGNTAAGIPSQRGAIVWHVSMHYIAVWIEGIRTNTQAEQIIAGMTNETSSHKKMSFNWERIRGRICWLPLKKRVHVIGRLSKDLIETLNPFCAVRCPTGFQSAYPIYFYRHAQRIKRRMLCGISTELLFLFLFLLLSRVLMCLTRLFFYNKSCLSHQFMMALLTRTLKQFPSYNRA